MTEGRYAFEEWFLVKSLRKVKTHTFNDYIFLKKWVVSTPLIGLKATNKNNVSLIQSFQINR